MRETLNNALDNSFAKMFNTNRDYVSTEMDRLLGVDARSVSYRRNSILDFGARQLANYTGEDNFFTVGSTVGSTIVGT